MTAITAETSLADVAGDLVKRARGTTDCTLPITWALAEGRAVDVFVVLTNNALWTFAASPVETLRKHRQVGLPSPALLSPMLMDMVMAMESCLVMCGLTGVGHAVADMEDRGLLNICGFDTRALNVIRSFAKDLI
ncbi:hypothetical protein CRUP_032814 [Coryphaenoides rupestris]|nr:hypothetical protein CRUP_032814 [Coryphaenoides rupestris]